MNAKLRTITSTFLFVLISSVFSPTAYSKQVPSDDISATQLRNVFYYGPLWSPDGNSLIFVASVAGNDDILQFDLGTNEARNLTSDNSGFDSFPSWSPNAQSIAFVSDRAGQPDIWVKNLATGNLLNLTANVSNPAFLPQWSPDGQFVAYITYGNPRHDLWISDPEGVNTTNLTETSNRRYEQFTWSTDSSRIAVAVVKTTPDLNSSITDANDLTDLSFDGLSIIEIEDRTIIPITENRWDAIPNWSPINNSILTNDPANGDIWLLDIDKNTRVNLDMVVLDYVYDPAWSPDGQQITFTGRRNIGGNSEIWITDIDRLNLKQLKADADVNYRYPRWSPDGERIAFEGNRAGTGDVWIIEVDGSNAINLGALLREES